MGITQPSIYKIAAFDASSYSSVSINIAVISNTDISQAPNIPTNIINIYNNLSDVNLYPGGASTPLTYNATASKPSQGLYVFTFNIPSVFAGLLENGESYYIVATMTSGGTSLVSNGAVFYCYSSPVLTFINMPETYLLQKSFRVSFEYSQAEGELLNWYKIRLYQFTNENYAGIWDISNTYATNQIVVDNGGGANNFYIALQAVPVNTDISNTSYWVAYTILNTDYILSQESPTLYDLNLAYTFSGLSSGGVYYATVEAQTVYYTNLSLTSNTFAISLIENLNSPLIMLENVCDEGYISVRSFITDIEGTPNPVTLPYSGSVDLTTPGYSIEWSDGLVVNKDFTLQIWGKAFIKNVKILSLTNTSPLYGNVEISLYIIPDYEDVSKVKVALYAVPQVGNAYYTESNSITEPASNETLYIGLQRINALFNINIINLGE